LDEIILRIEKAEKLLRDAEIELKMSMYERCCSTASDDSRYRRRFEKIV